MKDAPIKKIPPEVADLSEKIGGFIQYWGFKKIHGQIWSHLYLSARPLDATELRYRLGVSKALISISIADLLKYNVIEEVGRRDRRRVLFHANPKTAEVICNVLRVRERKMLQYLQASHKAVKSMSKEDRAALDFSAEKLNTLGEMINGAAQTLDTIIDMKAASFELFKDFPSSGDGA